MFSIYITFNREGSLSEFVITRTHAHARAHAHTHTHQTHPHTRTTPRLVLLLVLMFGRVTASRRKFRHLDAPAFIFATNIQVLIFGKI